MGREPGIGPAQLTCPNTDTDHSDQSVPVLFALLFLEGRVHDEDSGRSPGNEMARSDLKRGKDGDHSHWH